MMNHNIRRIITCKEIIAISENELLEALASYGVSKVKRIKKRIGSNQVNTPSVILTFTGTESPPKIKINQHILHPKGITPRPTVCFKCLKIGHTKVACLSPNKICYNCSESMHTTSGEKCTRSKYCSRCKSDSHCLADKDCPTYTAKQKLLYQTNNFKNAHAKFNSLDSDLKYKINQILETCTSCIERIATLTNKIELIINRMHSTNGEECEEKCKGENDLKDHDGTTKPKDYNTEENEMVEILAECSTQPTNIVHHIKTPPAKPVHRKKKRKKSRESHKPAEVTSSSEKIDTDENYNNEQINKPFENQTMEVEDLPSFPIDKPQLGWSPYFDTQCNYSSILKPFQTSITNILKLQKVRKLLQENKTNERTQAHVQKCNKDITEAKRKLHGNNITGEEITDENIEIWSQKIACFNEEMQKQKEEMDAFFETNDIWEEYSYDESGNETINYFCESKTD